MIEIVPVKIPIQYISTYGLDDMFFERFSDVSFGINFKAAAAGRLSNKAYLGGRVEIGVGGYRSFLFMVGHFVNYYPWGKGKFTTWHDGLYFTGALNYRVSVDLFGGIVPFIGVGYDFRIGKRQRVAISPELAYYVHFSDENGYLFDKDGVDHVLALNVKLKLFTGKAKLLPPKSPRRAIR